jgi:hypothetical protein
MALKTFLSKTPSPPSSDFNSTQVLEPYGSTGLIRVLYTYTGCPRMNVPDFERVFLKLKYTDITQNTYIQSSTVTEIMAREKWGLLAVPNTATCTADVSRDAAHVLETGMQYSYVVGLYQNAQSAKLNQYFHIAGYSCAM